MAPLIRTDVTASNVETIGILGAGRVGTAVARQAMKAGYAVKIATAKPVEEIRLIAEIIVPGAQAATAAEAAESDIVVIAIPLHKYRTLDPQMLAGKTVIDVMNYWAPIDGELDDFENDPRTSSEVIADFLSKSKLVKSLNHIGYRDMEVDDRPAGAPDRRALAIASDHADSAAMVAAFIDRLGYDPVVADSLAASRAFQPGSEIFKGSHQAGEMAELLETACDRVSA